jgi:uncharacterized protein YndB with AHSA1/START domain
MTDRNATHATFCLERVYPATPAKVFHAFADPEAKAQWFAGGPDQPGIERCLDFRVGGSEMSSGRFHDGPVHRYDARYYDIVPDERIVYSYEMHLDDVRISVSLTTIELRPEGSGTRLVLTEQGVFLDGYDDAGAREHGTRELLEALGQSLAAEVARA